MEQSASIRSIFINLPVTNIAQTRAFWSKLGFRFNEAFSNDKALCLILQPDSIYAMLITREYLQTFTNRPVADGSTTQVLLAIDVGSRERVEEIMRIAVENGATRYLQPEDLGWMVYDRFADLDGNQWEITYLDSSLIPQAEGK